MIKFNEKKSLIIIFLIISLINSFNVIAIPQISNIQGQVNHNAQITITGQGFGIKQNTNQGIPAAPLIWDVASEQFLGGINQNAYTGLPDGSNINTAIWKNIQASGSTTKYTTTRQHRHQRSSAHYFGTGSKTILGEPTYPTLGQTPSTQKKFYLSFYRKLRNPAGGSGGGDGSTKLIRIDTVPSFSLTGTTFITNDGIFTKDASSWVNIGQETSWVRWEIYVDSQKQWFDVWKNGRYHMGSYSGAGGSLELRPASDWRFRTGINGYEFKSNYVPSGEALIPGTFAYDDSHGLSNGQEVDISEIYYDNTLARIEISDRSTWIDDPDTMHLREVQGRILNWTDNSITLLINQGGFSDLNNKYVYVIDANGGVNTNGYPLSATPPTPDTTAPIISGGLPTGILTAGTTSTTLSLNTNEASSCRYSTTPNTTYSSITNSFTSTSGTTHTRSITGLTNGQTYNYYIRCIDTSNNANTNDYRITFSIATQIVDTSAPSQVTGLTASTASTTQFNLSWNAATDNIAVIGYKIYRNNIQVGTAIGTTYQDTGLTQNTTYTYKVSAYDASGNHGQNSTTISATTQANIVTPLPTNNSNLQNGKLLAAYAFEENTLQAVNDVDNQFATLNGALVTTGKYGQGIILDGVNDYIQLPKAYSSGSQEFTLEFWIYPQRWDSTDTIYDEWSQSNYWQFTITPGNWVTRDTSTTTTGTRNNDLGLPTLPTNTWSHIAFIYSDSQNLKSIFVNGVHQATTTTSIDTLTTARDNNARIGFPSDGTYFQGIIDEIRIYNKTLSAQEILLDMNTPIRNQTTTTPQPIEGDVNGDNVVNLFDINMVVAHFGKTNGYPNGINLASPTSIDLFDVMVIIRNWGRTN